MKSFNEYFESKQLAQEERERAIAEERKKAEVQEEQREAGWNEFTTKQNVVEAYIEWITRSTKR